MKFVYIVGLEHSGTTLITHLLSQHPSVLGLGEIGYWFSPGRMKFYMKTWGELPDSQICSCGSSWYQCAIWKNIIHLNGLNSDDSLLNKYQHLLEYVDSKHSQFKVIVDSSKSLEHLDLIWKNRTSLGLSENDIFVIHAFKDVRSFTFSILNKAENSFTALSAIRTFNWWLGANKRIAEYLDEWNTNHLRLPYESICENVDETLKSIYETLNLEKPDKVQVDHASSHIAIGNKDFTVRNRKEIAIDERWKNSNTIHLIHGIHFPAKRFSRQLHNM